MPDSSAAASPVFIVGAERSGSTLLRVMLDGHHDIACIGQFEYSVDAYGPAGAPSMAAYLEMLETDRVFQLHDLTIDETLDVPALVRSFLEQDRVRQGATVPMGVVHRNFEYLPAIFPDARYIHLIRDPRDVARSAIGMGWAADTWHGVEPWIHAEEQWDELVADLDDDQWMEVRYEDLVSDHVATLEALCVFVGVTPALDELLSYADETDYSHPDASLANQWVKRASDDDVRFVELRVGAVMAGRGYEPSGRELRPLAGFERARLTVVNKLKTFQARAKFLGLPLAVGTTVASRLGSRRLQAMVARRSNAIENSKLKRSWRDGSATDRTLTGDAAGR